MLLQKKYTPDVFPYRLVKNKGDIAQYYVYDVFPAIVDRELFQKALDKIKKRALKYNINQTGENQIYAFTSKIVCEDCGTRFKRKVVRKKEFVFSIMDLKYQYNLRKGVKIVSIIINDRTPTVKPKVNIIAPRKKYKPNVVALTRKLRVGAYCRVSTDSDEQELSFDTQCDFYEKLINNNPEWEFAGIYADEGITGTSLEKRDDFNRMMEDARLGKLDMIITKNVPRFARNTVDALNSLRQLKEYGVDVYFEIEQIHSLEENEMLMTILASVAQQHSEEKSNAVRWGYERQFEKGKVYGSNLYGYKSNKGTLEIIEKEAKVVKSIFTMYLSGMSEIQIAKELTQRGVLTKSGKSKWSAGTIGRMLQNEKYCGDALMQKTFNIDFLHKKRYKNIGQRKMFYIENSHPAIISKEIYKEAQVERTKRKSNQVIELNSDKQVSNRRYSAKNPLSNRIICSDCGSLYRRAVWRKRDGTKEPVWRCGNKLVNGKGNCPHSITIKEALLFKLLRHSIQEKFNEKNNLKESLAKILSEYINPKDIKERQ